VVRERREVREGVVLVTFGSSSVERAHNLWNGGASWRFRSRGAFANLCVCGGYYQGSGAPWYP